MVGVGMLNNWRFSFEHDRVKPHGLKRFRFKIIKLRVLGKGVALMIDTPWVWCDVCVYRRASEQ